MLPARPTSAYWANAHLSPAVFRRPGSRLKTPSPHRRWLAFALHATVQTCPVCSEELNRLWSWEPSKSVVSQRHRRVRADARGPAKALMAPTARMRRRAFSPHGGKSARGSAPDGRDERLCRFRANASTPPSARLRIAESTSYRRHGFHGSWPMRPGGDATATGPLVRSSGTRQLTNAGREASVGGIATREFVKERWSGPAGTGR